MPGGRPTKLTPEVQKKLCDAIAAGNYYQAACGYAGIEYTTFRKWMRRGKKARRGEFFQFFHAVKKAEADAEVSAVALWKAQMPENWQACRDFLARRHPKRWGVKDSLELQGNSKKPLRVSLEKIVAGQQKAMEYEQKRLLEAKEPTDAADSA